MMNWIGISKKKPKDGQQCLTKMKHGIIEGAYNAEDGVFEQYYWTDMSWHGDAWVPIEDVE